VSVASLPTGVVTFLMSDVEASSRHWSEQPDEMAIAVRALDDVVTGAVEAHGGTVLKPRGEGDSHFAVFASPSAAVRAACAVQAGAAASLPVRVRIGVHSGELDPAAGDYYGTAVNQTARLRAVAHGGQTVLSSVTASLSRRSLPPEVRVRSLGHHRVRDFPGLEEVFQASVEGTADRFPPLVTGETKAPALLAIALIDVCDAHRTLSDAGGDVIEWQRQLADTLRAVAEPRGPAALKLLGDGCMAAFDDPLAAIGFVRDVRAAAAAHSIHVRCGVEVGRMALDDGDVVGPAAFVAAELCRRAVPDQILTSAAAAELAGVASEAVPLGRSRLRAIRTEVELVEL
jgi:class 3 adenylate cyclase